MELFKIKKIIPYVITSLMLLGCSGTMTIGDMTVSKGVNRVLKEYEWASNETHSKRDLQGEVIMLLKELQKKGLYGYADIQDFDNYLRKIDEYDGLRDGCINLSGVEKMREENRNTSLEHMFDSKLKLK